MNQPQPDPQSAPAVVSREALIRGLLRKFQPVVEKLLHRAGIAPETFLAQVGNAMRAQPRLWQCNPETVLGAALRCAQLGMPPNDGTNRAWIVPYQGEARFQLGYQGVLELARRAEPGLTFEGQPVYPNDIFELERTENGLHFRHRPYYTRKGKAGEDRGGDPRLWYVVATYPDGRRHVQVIDKNGVEYHRSFSKMPNGEMWKNSYDAAALKSCVMEMRRWLPVSPALAVAIESDGGVVTPDQVAAEDAEDAPDIVGELAGPAPADRQLSAGDDGDSVEHVVTALEDAADVECVEG